MALITKNGDQAKQADNAPKIEFPCDNYVVKVVAMEGDDLFSDVVSCFKRHAPEMDEQSVKENRSSKGRFVSYSFRIVAQNEEQLSSLHRDLMSISSVKMVM